MLHLFYNLLAMINAEFSSLLERSYAGNTVQGLLSALLVFLIALAALYAARRVLLSRLKLLAARTATDIDDFFIHLLEKIGSFELALLSLYLATRSLALSAGVDKALHLVFVIALSFRAVTLLQAAIAFGLRKAMGSSEREADSSSAMQVLHLVLNVAVWAGAIIFILDNLGINISAMVAGLGIGGVAVALAAQQILGDLFSSFVIFMDKPFAIGDFIVLGDIRGTVERVGIKTTRVRSLSGELLVVPNKDLTSSVLRNYKQMQRRRIVMSFGVTEPNAGTDTSRIQTRAVRTGDRFVVDGRKVWNTNAQHATHIMLLARTAPRDPAKPFAGLTLFFAEFDRARITVREIEKLGRAAVDSNEIFIDGLEVPAENVVGEVDRGFHHLLDSLNPERIFTGIEAVGIGRAALELAVRYAKERVVFDRPIGQNQAIAHPLALAWAKLEAAEAMCLKAAWLFDTGRPCGREANAAKLMAAEAGFSACDVALQTFGGYGYAKEFHVERLWREIRLYKIAPVSQQMVLNYLAEHVLGLPRSY